jgi:hypothetical protein
MADVGDIEMATFVQDEGSIHRDSVRFPNGKVLSIQLLGPGVTAWLVSEADFARSVQKTTAIELA